MKTRVTLVDENKRQADTWKQNLVALKIKGLEVDTLDVTKELEACVSGLTERREVARRVKRSRAASDERTQGILERIDKTDIFIVDNDLLGEDTPTRDTGEDIAYLVRCYSTCKVIVAVNQFTSENIFDLNLTGHPESFADINISAAQMNNPGLWRSPWTEPFRPWYWPVLPDLARRFEARVDCLRDHLHDKVLSTLGFDDAVARRLPRAVEAFLCRKGAVKDTTFDEFVRLSGNGLRPKDKASDEQLCRIAAARVTRWLEDLVLSGQEILVDAPHLIGRNPGLLGTTGKKWNKAVQAAWNKTAHIPPYEKDSNIEAKLDLDEGLAGCRLDSMWTSRPAWFWDKIVASGKHIADRDLPSFEPVAPVFCEDTSRFEDRANARQFVAKVESPHVRRYANGAVPGVTYSPETRFSM